MEITVKSCEILRTIINEKFDLESHTHLICTQYPSFRNMGLFATLKTRVHCNAQQGKMGRVGKFCDQREILLSKQGYPALVFPVTGEIL